MAGRILIKASPTEDFYVLWSMVADGPLSYGTRENLTAKRSLKGLFTGEMNLKISNPKVFEVADKFGSSSLHGAHGAYDWEDGSLGLLFIWEGEPRINGLVPRSKFHDFMREYVLTVDQEFGYALLAHLDDSQIHYGETS